VSSTTLGGSETTGGEDDESSVAESSPRLGIGGEGGGGGPTRGDAADGDGFGNQAIDDDVTVFLGPLGIVIESFGALRSRPTVFTVAGNGFFIILGLAADNGDDGALP
jgi:hypothetical protein